MNFSIDTLVGAVITVLTLVVALLPHEIAHGYTAYWLGDRTAKMMGRLSMNPIKHINPVYAGWILLGVFAGKLFPAISFLTGILTWVGFVLLLKPVPVNPANFNDPKRGMAITALMGPVTNLVIGFVSMLLFYLLVIGLNGVQNVNDGWLYLADFLSELTYYSVALAVFNLIPVPPLDGSRVLFSFLPDRYYFKVMQYERYIMIGFLLLVYSGSFDFLLSNATSRIITSFSNICQKILVPILEIVS